jgi:hypothetical protein
LRGRPRLLAIFLGGNHRPGRRLCGSNRRCRWSGTGWGAPYVSRSGGGSAGGLPFQPANTGRAATRLQIGGTGQPRPGAIIERRWYDTILHASHRASSHAGCLNIPAISKASVPIVLRGTAVHALLLLSLASGFALVANRPRRRLRGRRGGQGLANGRARRIIAPLVWVDQLRIRRVKR